MRMRRDWVNIQWYTGIYCEDEDLGPYTVVYCIIYCEDEERLGPYTVVYWNIYSSIPLYMEEGSRSYTVVYWNIL